MCHTHGVGSAHHARFDGVPVSVPIVATQGLAIVLGTAANRRDFCRMSASIPRKVLLQLGPSFHLSNQHGLTSFIVGRQSSWLETDIQEKEQKESQKQAISSTGRKGPNQVEV
ncbi:hypothetical protein Tco_0492013 [Tanacetum coccineum]